MIVKTCAHKYILRTPERAAHINRGREKYLSTCPSDSTSARANYRTRVKCALSLLLMTRRKVHCTHTRVTPMAAQLLELEEPLPRLLRGCTHRMYYATRKRPLISDLVSCTFFFLSHKRQIERATFSPIQFGLRGELA